MSFDAQVHKTTPTAPLLRPGVYSAMAIGVVNLGLAG